MKRRDFIAALGGAAAWPLVAQGQQQAKLPLIGFLGSGTPESHGHWLAAFLQRLHELGWIEGRNLSIEYRWANGSTDRAAEFAAEFEQAPRTFARDGAWSSSASHHGQCQQFRFNAGNERS